MRNAQKIRQAEEKLGQRLPEKWFQFIANLEDEVVKFGEEEWLFFTATEDLHGPGNNFILTASENFREEWKINGFVIADNGLGDALVLLPDENGEGFLEPIFVMMHEMAEIKIFAFSYDQLFNDGPVEYLWDNEFYFKIDDSGETVRGTSELRPYTLDDVYDEDHKLRHHLDDLIDDHKTELTSDIIQGLEKLSTCSDKQHAAWALNKFSDIYLRGFGPIPQNLQKALEYNQQAMDLGSHKAFSNRAACYFAGIGGIERDLAKALEFAIKANELSKSNLLADLLASEEGGGMYDDLVKRIEMEMKREARR